MSVVVKDIKKFNFETQVEIAKDLAMARTAELLTTFIQNLTPVKTGRLKSSIHPEKLAVGEYQVKTDVDYAGFIEFGTIKMKPRAMFREGYDSNINRLEEEFGRQFIKILLGV